MRKIVHKVSHIVNNNIEYKNKLFLSFRRSTAHWGGQAENNRVLPEFVWCWYWSWSLPDHHHRWHHLLDQQGEEWGPRGVWAGGEGAGEQEEEGQGHLDGREKTTRREQLPLLRIIKYFCSNFEYINDDIFSETEYITWYLNIFLQNETLFHFIVVQHTWRNPGVCHILTYSDQCLVAGVMGSHCILGQHQHDIRLSISHHLPPLTLIAMRKLFCSSVSGDKQVSCNDRLSQVREIRNYLNQVKSVSGVLMLIAGPQWHQFRVWKAAEVGTQCCPLTII